MKTVEYETKLALDDTATQPVRLTVTVGNAQIGGSVVKIDDHEVADGRNIRDLDLGPEGSLIGKALTVRTVVTDVNPSTNRLVVTYELKTSSDELSHRLRTSVSSNDSAFFELYVEFRGS